MLRKHRSLFKRYGSVVPVLLRWFTKTSSFTVLRRSKMVSAEPSHVEHQRTLLKVGEVLIKNDKQKSLDKPLIDII